MKEYLRKICASFLILDRRSPWINALPAALVSSIIITMTSTAAVSMIFKGSLTSYIPIGMSCALISAIIVNGFNYAFSSFPFSVSCMTPNAAVIMGLFTYEISKQNLPPLEAFYTLFTGFILVSFLTAIFLFLVGFFKIGTLIRYMPYPVLCGFFAGVGWYLFSGAFLIVGIDLRTFSPLTQDISVEFSLVLPLLFGISAFIIQKNFKTPPTYILFLFGTVFLFYVCLWIFGIPLEVAIQKHLMVQSAQSSFLYGQFSFSFLNYVHWNEIFSRWGHIFAFAMVNLLSLLAYAVNFEEVSHTTTDLDREVKIAGLANIFSSFFSGGTAIFSTQSLVHRAYGGGHRISLLYLSFFCSLILLFSHQLISYIPKFFVSGLLITNGFFLIEKWLVGIFKQVSWDEGFIIVIIFFVMVFQGFIPGVAMGLALAFLLFIFNNSQMQLIRYEIPGTDFISNASYPIKILKKLQKSGNKIYIIKLQGYFFFGSAEKLTNHIKEKLSQNKEIDQKIEYVVLDFSFVTGMDSTATHTLLNLQSLFKKQSCTLILTNLNKKSRNQLRMQGKDQRKLEFIPYFKAMEIETKNGIIYVFEDMDAGLEWAERNLLQDLEGPFSPESHSGFKEFLNSTQDIKQFQKYLQKVYLKKGDFLRVPENGTEGIFFIESGRVVYLIKKNGHGYKRIREFGSGHIIGELQFYGGENTSTEEMIISCVEDCSFYKMDQKNLHRLEKEHPQIALHFNKWMIQILSERLSHTTREIRSLV